MEPSIAAFDPETGVAAVDSDWRVRAWSPSAARYTGRAADDVVGGEVWAALPALHRHPIEETLRAVLADGDSRTVVLSGRAAEGGDPLLELEICRVDDRLLFLMRSGHATPAPVAPDLSLSPDAEERIWARLFEVLQTPALLLTDAGRILRANEAAARLLRTSLGGLGSRAVGEWVAGTEWAGALARVRTATQRLSVVLEFPDRSPALEAQLILTATDPLRRTSRLLCFVVAVPRELQLQGSLARADRLAPLGALVAGVAHCLQEPITAIAAFAGALRDEAQNSAVAAQADAICVEAAGATRVLHGLLAYTRQQITLSRAVDLAPLVERVLTLRRPALREAGITTTIAIAPTLPRPWGDPQAMELILFNGLLNAEETITATGGPGAVTLTARPCDGRVLVTIEDDGPGVPSEALMRVFEPFYTTRGDPGAGLGLALSYGGIRDLGGRIWMQNLAAGGARLSLEFPVEPIADPPPARALRILVVDALGTRRRATQFRAEQLGHRVETARSAHECVERLHRRNASYDLILLDVELDGVETGLDLYDTLVIEGQGRERDVILTTGDQLTRATAARLDATDRPILRTPAPFGELRELLERRSPVPAS